MVNPRETSMMAKYWLPAAAVAMVLAAPAWGHAKLLSTSPAADAKLSAAPKSLTLSFNENVRIAVVTLKSGGKDIPVAVDRNAPAAPQVTIPLPPLAIGKYQVQWSALSSGDGHVTKGTFSFAIVGRAAAP
jgi:methionine-rich copper-binding protein CopC